MTSPLILKDRDRELLAALVQKVRLLSQKQIAEHWWQGETPNARRRLKSLVEAGLLKRLTVSARTLPPITAPLVTWQLSEVEPDFGPIAFQLQSRWARRAVRPTTTYIASEKASQLFGGRARGELKHPLQATHDLGVAAVWLALAELAPKWANAWQGEDLHAVSRRGEKLPDAFIVNSAQETVCVIEFGGAYDTARLLAFHRDCEVRAIPYQIW